MSDKPMRWDILDEFTGQSGDKIQMIYDDNSIRLQVENGKGVVSHADLYPQELRDLAARLEAQADKLEGKA